MCRRVSRFLWPRNGAILGRHSGSGPSTTPTCMRSPVFRRASPNCVYIQRVQLAGTPENLAILHVRLDLPAPVAGGLRLPGGAVPVHRRPGLVIVLGVLAEGERELLVVVETGGLPGRLPRPREDREQDGGQ